MKFTQISNILMQKKKGKRGKLRKIILRRLKRTIILRQGSIYWIENVGCSEFQLIN